jgi:cyclopropane-fatty-acyl-phospholipid synthase
VFVEKRIDTLARRIRTATPLPLTIRLWNGTAYELGPAPIVTLTFKSPAALSCLIRPDFATLGEAFIEERIDVDGPLRDIVRAVDGLIHGASSHVARWARLRPAVHTRSQDAAAIAHHYDVSNEFYALWLDRQMVYSCAYFESGEEDIDAAQSRKFDHICRKLRLSPGERLLDIGCGWGGLVAWAARNHGVDATGITLSREQLAHAARRIAVEGLAERCRVELLDYRDVPDTAKYDKIASIGMFEHVGLTNLRPYFAKIRGLLSDRGIVLNHGITTMDPMNRAVGMGAGAFIDRHIFPHGELPHLSLAVRTMSEAGLEVVDVESLRFHYARTLWLWATRLEAQRARAIELVGERRYRTWLIYLAGCAHAFQQGWISLHQLLAVRADRSGMAPVPWTRGHMYH